MSRYSALFSQTCLRGLAAAALLAPLASCTSSQLNGVSPSYLIIENLEASSGAQPSELGNVLASDVLTIVGQGAEARATIFEDGGVVQFRLGLRDPGSIDAPSTPSSANFITLDRYHVRYIRADGRNTQGVDVPYEFDGAATATVGASGGSLTFTLVRLQAKVEAPLRSMVGLSGAFALSTIAEVTFYGHDQAGREVSATGHISVTFADWGDPS